MNPEKSIIVGLTGASGMIYGKRLLDDLTAISTQIGRCHVVFSGQARKVWEFEIGTPEPWPYPFPVFGQDDFFAPMASGSAGFHTMIICPCSMGTLGRIASGVSSDLMTRAADVMLKERRQLILVPRETPYNLIHLRNMELLTQAGAIICPASPSFYQRPSTIDELVATVTDRVLQLAGFRISTYRWGEDE